MLMNNIHLMFLIIHLIIHFDYPFLLVSENKSGIKIFPIFNNNMIYDIQQDISKC